MNNKKGTKKECESVKSMTKTMLIWQWRCSEISTEWPSLWCWKLMQVVRCCIEHSASVAKSFLTSNAVVIERKELQPITLPPRKAMATPNLAIPKDLAFSKGLPMSKDLAMSKGHFTHFIVFNFLCHNIFPC